MIFSTSIFPILSLRNKCLLFLFLSTAISSIAAAEAVPTPESLPGGKIITVQEAKKLLDQSGALFYDTRGALNYGRGHIPGAIFAPYKGESKKVVDFDASLDQPSMDKLPAEKSKPVIIYSHGDTGWKSYKTAVLAIRDGYTHVMWLRQGYSEWKNHGYPVE